MYTYMHSLDARFILHMSALVHRPLLCRMPSLNVQPPCAKLTLYMCAEHATNIFNYMSSHCSGATAVPVHRLLGTAHGRVIANNSLFVAMSAWTDEVYKLQRLISWTQNSNPHLTTKSRHCHHCLVMPPLCDSFPAFL